MKIIFLPKHGRVNPYQQLLVKSLRAQGLTVQLKNGNGPFPILGAIRKYGMPQILHLHWTHPFLACDSILKTAVLVVRFFCELLVLKSFGVKLVWTIHNLFHHEKRVKGERHINKMLVGICNQIIVHASFGKAEAGRAYGLSLNAMKKINVIPHGHYMDIYENRISKDDARRKLGLNKHCVVFLYFGIIRPYKGIPQLLTSFGDLDNKDVNLVIAGMPKGKDVKEKILESAKSDKRIRTYLYEISEDAIQMYMNASDVVILPFQNVFTSGSVLLSMSFGKAVIAPNFSFLKETVHSKGAIFYKSDDPGEMKKALLKALDSDLNGMGRYNYEMAKNYDWKAIGQKTCEVYQKCLER